MQISQYNLFDYENNKFGVFLDFDQGKWCKKFINTQSHQKGMQQKAEFKAQVPCVTWSEGLESSSYLSI